MNDIGKHLTLFEGFEPFSGYVPKGYLVDFLGCLTDATFRTMWGVDPASEGGKEVRTKCPRPACGERFFEAVNWLEVARQALGQCTMITLGACYGVQAVAVYKALQRLNPMPAKLVAVEPDPENFVWLQKHFLDNGIDPGRHWLLQCALSDNTQPVLFPAGSPGSGVQSCHETNLRAMRMEFARDFLESPEMPERVWNLIVDGDTGIDINLAPGWNFPARVKFASAVSLVDVLGPFDRVDFLESDIQQSEQEVFPPAMDAICAKVKRVHIGTHGAFVHDLLLQEFALRRWQVVFNYPPNTDHETEWGAFHINDGVLTAVNPAL